MTNEQEDCNYCSNYLPHNLGFIKLPEQVVDNITAAEEAIKFAKKVIDDGKVMYLVNGGPAHPLSGNEQRLRDFGVELYAIGACDTNSHIEIFTSVFDKIMQYQEIKCLKNVNLLSLLIDVVWSGAEHSNLAYQDYLKERV